MAKLAYTTLLKDDPELQQQYRKHHANTWPEVVESFRKIGVTDLNIWLNGRRLFMVAEVAGDFNYAAGLGAYLALDPKCREWEGIMDQFQEAPADAPEGEKWVPLEHLFAL
ncbi:MAG: L-rhamnose mutarotase [Kiritimatiellia bacterium]|jgi:L-rhamnose mutarotase